MKRTLFFAFTAIMAAGAMAQTDDYVTPYEWMQAYAQCTSHNGKFVAAQDIFYECFLYDAESMQIITYQDVYPGDGNYLADNGAMVGQEVNTSMPVIMKDGEVIIPASISADFPYGGIFEAVTGDGRYATGYVNQYTNPMYIPVVYDIENDTYVKLPYPSRDFFGGRAQGYIPHVISDDGTVVAGLVMDSSGMYNWPIVWRQGDNGNWTYSQPTESLFNKDGKQLPLSPDEYPGTSWESYWKQMYELGYDQMFGGSMAISPDGKTMATCSLVMPGNEASTEAAGFYPAIFNLEDDSFEIIVPENDQLMPNQILSDGTILAVSSPYAFMPYVAYMLLPETEEFVIFTDWLEANIPQYWYWLADNLGQYGVVGYDDNGDPLYGDYIISGRVSMSEDMSTIAGGVPIGDLISYVYHDSDEFVPDGVDEIIAEPAENGRLDIYNINGVKVNATSLDELPRGIYIVNGKKIAK